MKQEKKSIIGFSGGQIKNYIMNFHKQLRKVINVHNDYYYFIEEYIGIVT